MLSKRKKVYSDDLLNITNTFLDKIEDIEKKLGKDQLINQGLFLMTTALFEDSIRELMKIVLVSFPEKLNKKSCSISREQLCMVADKGHSVIIENELYFMFKEGVKSQLEDLLKILFNKDNKKEGKKDKNNISDNEIELITKIDEISLFRNSLIHNGGKPNITLIAKAKYFKVNAKEKLSFDNELISKFIKEYKKFIRHLKTEINLTFDSYNDLSIVQKIKKLWSECFSSPILGFENYWVINNDKDLIVDVKYPEIESQISSSEKVLLSIWRHQFNDSIKTEDFLLCSVNYHKIYELYKGLDNLKFYHMKQKADRLK